MDNTFVRGPSPSYSDEENALTATLPICSVDLASGRHESVYDDKLNSLYDAASYSSDDQKRRGNHSFAFWIVVTILLVLCIGNLILTITIMGVLKLGKGIHGMELIPEEEAVKFYGSTDLDRVYTKTNGHIEGFLDVPISITAENNQSVYVRLHRNGGGWSNRLMVDRAGIQFRSVNTFEVKDPVTGSNIFSTHRPHYNLPSGANRLMARTISASRVQSPIDSPLSFNSDGKVSIRGSEGILVDGSSTVLQAEHNVHVNSTQGGTILEANAGIYLDMDKMPMVSSEFGLRTGNFQYKICVCMPQGILFRIPIPRVHNAPKVSCAHFSANTDPCATN